MRIHKLEKIAVRVTGNAEKFLNGLTSNTLDQPHNAFLNLHGRIIATFDQIKTAPDEFLLVISPAAWGPLKDHTGKYARLNQTTVEPLPLNTYFDLDGNALLEKGDVTVAQKAGRLILTARQLPQDVSPSEFTLFRLHYAIALHGVDYQDEMVLNVDENAFVSFTKGCFLGQEPVAKVHNRAKPTWKLAVRYKDELPPPMQEKMTSVCVDPQTSREKGFVFIPNT